MKAIMTVTCVVGENIGSVSSSAHNNKGKKTDSKLGLEGPPAVFIERHVRQPCSMQYIALKDIAQGKHHLNFALPSLRVLLPSQPLPNSQLLLLFSFSGSALVGSHSPQNIICSLKGVLVGADLPASSLFLLMWVSAQILSFTLGGSS